MRVGVYIDGFNLYYGGRSLCGRGRRGWRWLDIGRLSATLLPPYWIAAGATVSRVVCCTARVHEQPATTAASDQEIYLRALRASGACDEIIFGSFVSRVKQLPLATPTASGRPRLVTVNDSAVLGTCPGLSHSPSSGKVFASIANREEKGSDVNVATTLLVDVLSINVDYAIVISNDSDLERPIREARARVPVGVVNPSANRLAGALRGRPDDGVGGHWWRQLNVADFTGNQFTERVHDVRRPVGW